MQNQSGTSLGVHLREVMEEAQDNWRMTVLMLNTGEDGRVRNERAVKNAGTNKQVIFKAMEDMKEMNSTAHESVM